MSLEIYSEKKMKKFEQMPQVHREFLLKSAEILKKDKRILGVAAGGSVILKNMDEFSDLDLVLVIEPKKYDEVLKNRKSIAQSMGPLLESFTGEHVGEPRLLICLYGPPLLHVDLKFISLIDIDKRVEDPIIVWERNSILSKRLSKTESKYPPPDLAWIENRFWIWIHYIAGKIGRGELFEIIDALSFLRSHVLGPMILHRVGARPQGVRRIEEYGIEYLKKLKQTIPQHNQVSCFRALEATINLYENLQKEISKSDKVNINKALVTEVKKYLSYIERKISR